MTRWTTDTAPSSLGWVGLLAGLLTLAGAAWAPAVLAQGAPEGRELPCRSHALASQQDPGARVIDLVLDPDPELQVYRQSIGSQWVDSVLTGTGALRREDGAEEEFRYSCYLDDAGEVLGFHAVPLDFGPALRACYRWAALRPEVSACLEALKAEAESDLIAAYRAAVEQAASLGEATGRSGALTMMEASDLAWRALRQSECERIEMTVAGSRGPGDRFLACWVDMTRERSRMLRSTLGGGH